MFNYLKIAVAIAATVSLTVFAQERKIEGVGRTATPNEIKAWDIDVRPDFKGLPKGQGSVKQGENVWEAQCASCHGSFGENNTVFSALVGFTTKKDVETGRVASLLLGSTAPTRTTMMKVSQLSTLWDYINRAMPWTAPKSLSANDVYALTAYLLNLANVVPDDFTLSDMNMAETQKKIPNRNGMTTAHAMWPGKEFGGTSKPDVQGSSCINNCATELKVASMLPDSARNAHGNLADQSRDFGVMRGSDTSKSPAGANTNKQTSAISTAPKVAEKPSDASGVLKSKDVTVILNKNACSTCHNIESKIVGPAFKDIAAKHSARADVVDYLTAKIKSGGSGVYGVIPMPPQSLSEEDAKKVAQWIAQGAAK